MSVPRTDQTTQLKDGADSLNGLRDSLRRFAADREWDRSQELVEAAKRYHGVTCVVCSFNFGEAYGTHGEGFIEAHHLVPVAVAAKRGMTKKDAKTDMTVLCANCHRMVHRGRVLVSVGALKAIVSAQRRGKQVKT